MMLPFRRGLLSQTAALMPAAGGGFTDPTSVPNLYAWHDPTDGATVTLVSGNASQVDDKSGNSRPLVRTDAGTRPGYATSAPNGASVLTFSGGQRIDWLFNVNQPITIITALKNSTNGAYVYDGYGGRIALAFFNASASSNSDHITAYAGTGLGNDGIAASTSVDLVMSVVYNGGSSRIRRNGVQIASGAVGSNNITAGLAFGSSLVAMTGYIGQDVIYTGDPGDTAIANVENYCAAKLGITF